MTGTMKEMKAPDVSRCQSLPREPTISASRWVITCTSGVAPTKMRATR